MNKCFITGADAQLQDLLPWWIENIRRHDKETHIVVADFGMSKQWHEWTTKNVNKVIKYPKHNKHSWFWKPHTMIVAPYEYKCWIDLDCEVLQNITDIFDYVDGSNMGLTADPCRRREADNRDWLATGVNVVKGQPNILKMWVENCKESWLRGDQEVLHDILKEKKYMQDIVVMPMEYQWLRILLAQGKDHANKKIVHWTGPVGKQIIREKRMK